MRHPGLVALLSPCLALSTTLPHSSGLKHQNRLGPRNASPSKFDSLRPRNRSHNWYVGGPASKDPQQQPRDLLLFSPLLLYDAIKWVTCHNGATFPTGKFANACTPRNVNMWGVLVYRTSGTAVEPDYAGSIIMVSRRGYGTPEPRSEIFLFKVVVPLHGFYSCDSARTQVLAYLITSPTPTDRPDLSPIDLPQAQDTFIS